MENNKDNNLAFPPVIFGTSSLGNLFVALDDEIKERIVKACFKHSPKPVVFDTAGKYGAGLALESLGKSLKALNINQEDVIISNKLGWVRTELKTPEPTFEPYVWKNLKYDAVQKISYDGILECFEQGNQLLNGYIPQMVSVHDPDEYLDAAVNQADEEKRYQDILEAYKALKFLKDQGKVKAIGVGAKKWKSIEKISQNIDLDWIMIANSMTIKSHPPELIAFIERMSKKGVKIINSAVFHSGFLTGGDFHDYIPVKREEKEHQHLFEWRDKFYDLCKQFDIKPAEASVQFALKIPGVSSIALSTTNPDRVEGNVDMANKHIPEEFWNKMAEENLIQSIPVNK